MKFHGTFVHFFKTVWLFWKYVDEEMENISALPPARILFQQKNLFSTFLLGNIQIVRRISNYNSRI